MNGEKRIIKKYNEVFDDFIRILGKALETEKVMGDQRSNAQVFYEKET
jgi:hypothetical protein